MTMTLFLASAFFLIAAGSQAVLNFFESRPHVNAFFNSEHIPTQPEIDVIKKQAEDTGLVETFTYVSKEDALNIYKSLNQNNTLLLEAVTSQMLPASVEISTKKPEDLKIVADVLKVQKDIEDVQYAEDIVGTLTKWTSSVRTIGAALVGTHVLITLIIILLIIGLKVSNRRDEIQLLQLVGATPWFISAPFILEGIIYGVVGGTLAWGVSYILLLSSMDFLNTFLSGIPILPVPLTFMLQLLGGEVALGTLVGGLGGVIATRRFLKA
jgi:cell division transport system permease protein